MKQMTRRTTASIYRTAVKPALFRMAPDSVHEKMLRSGRVTQNVPAMRALLRGAFAHKDDAMLHQTVFGMQFKNPVGLSAGLDKNAELVPTLRSIGFGFATIGSISADAAPGNPKPWFYRLPQSKSLVVHAGLANQGVDIITRRINGYDAAMFEDFPLVASVAKTNSPKTNTDETGIADYVECVQKIRLNPRVALIELNISCPNTFGGEPFTRPEPLETLLREIDALNLVQPLTIKMPIDKPWQEFDALLRVILKHKVAAVTIGNLQKNRAAVPLKDELPDTIPGSLSGRPCFEQSNDLISRTYQKYGDSIVIIGVGGIFSAQDAYEKITRGATLVELITGMIFKGPQLIGQINHDLSALLKKDGYENISEAIGAKHRK